MLKRGLNWTTIGVAVAVMLLGALYAVGPRVYAADDHTVESKAGTVEKDDSVASDAEPVAGSTDDLGGGQVEITSPTFKPPGSRSFKEFEGTTTHVDIELDPAGINPSRDTDTSSAIQISGTFTEASAGTFPLKGEGNMAGGGGGGGGGQAVADTHWSAKVSKEGDILKLLAVPRVLAATSHGDVPIYFEIEGPTTAEIVTIKTTVKIGTTTIAPITTGTERLVGGDAVRTAEGSSDANGETNAYTVFVSAGQFTNTDLSSSGSYRSKDVQVKLEVSYKPDGDPTPRDVESDWLALDSFLDRNIDVCHLGAYYSNESSENPDFAALNPAAGASRRSWRNAIPYTRQLEPTADKWATHTASSIGTWWQHSTQTQNVEWKPYIGYIWRCRNAHWITGGEYNLTTRIDTGWIPFSDHGEQWMELMASEERASIFVWYWGLKEVEDLSGTTRTVLDLRRKTGTSNYANLYPGATVDLAVEDIGSAQGWSWGTSIDNSMAIAGGAVALLGSGPVGWAAGALAYATIISGSLKEASNILGGIRVAGGGSQGGKSSAYGVVTKNKADGDPMWAKFYGDSAVGLGGPNQDEFTQIAEGSKRKSASVFYESSAPALQTWKIMHAMTSAAWAEEGLLFNENAESWLRFNIPSQGSNRRYCTVNSEAVVTNAEDQYVGQE